MDLKLGHYNKDGIEVVDVEGEIDVYTAPRLRELLIDLVNKNNYQLVVNMEKVEFLDSTGLGVLVGGLTPGVGYRVEFVNPDTTGADAYQFTAQDQGANDAIDSDANPATGRSQIVTLSSAPGKLTLQGGKSRFTLQTLPADDFPLVNESVDFGPTFAVPQKTLRELDRKSVV